MKNIFSSGKAESNIHVGEAYVLWAQIQTWYDVLELMESLINHVKDADLKFMLEQGVKLISFNINKLEGVMEHYKVAFPPSPHKVLKTSSESSALRDEIIFRIIFDISQTSFLVHSKAISICLDDSLRKLFQEFMHTEMEGYNALVKLGKAKGWIHYPPAHKSIE